MSQDVRLPTGEHGRVPGHFVYIVECSDGTLYTGYARDVLRRIAMHNEGRGAKYTRGRGPVRLLYVESYADQGAALRRERAIKRLTHAQKLRLVATYQDPRGTA
ncbi:putative endonuclease [Alicyclobacillus hesperidum]|uniref:Putative endonuclease n=1 Tax=Alicyclobacillus hesperidum TaxID=89784 RepID=A0A1H2QY22_9BACL|nr:GIY-YIG nuclease family protein [Alicyclobacillus hesperidum]SDW11339.1 putative endonuclease [Alicyclobacillus hesperidum]